LKIPGLASARIILKSDSGLGIRQISAIAAMVFRAGTEDFSDIPFQQQPSGQGRNPNKYWAMFR